VFDLFAFEMVDYTLFMHFSETAYALMNLSCFEMISAL
jgi:hypothetical protein